LGSSILQAHNDFALPAISRPILQLFVIISIVVFGWSIGIYSYAIGTIVGLIVGLSIQMAAISRRGKVKLDFDFYHPVVKSSFSSLPPLIFARLLNHGTNIAITALASTLVVGSISALNFAWKIVSIPMLVLSSVSVVLYPGISEEIAKKDFFMVGRILRKAIRASIYIGAPFSMFFMVAGIPVVRLLFERGNFTPDQSYLTAKVLMAYCIMIVFQSVNLLIGNTYWALRLMKLRLKIEAVGVLVCIALSLILRRFLGPAGLAFSISCQYFVLMLIGLIILEKRVPISFNRGETIKFGFRISIACLFLGLAIKTSMWTFSSYFGSSLWGKTGYVLCLGLIGGVTYVVFCHLLKIGENKEVLVLCRGKIIYLMQGIRTRHFFV
jgi:putative peptidoglycan lipid II flippase